MLVVCKTEGCKNFGIVVERNLDSGGNYVMGANAICKECGNERITDEELNTASPSFNIDEIALGTKRLYETKVRKYN
jgi:thymidine kinase